VGGVSIPEAVHVIRRWAQSLAWACELSEEQARNSLLLWNRWTLDGERKFTFPLYLEMIRDCEQRTTVGSSSVHLGPRSLAEQECHDGDKITTQHLFALADADGDGVLNKSEFATLISGLLVPSPATSPRLPQVTRRR
jgi:hypothetical protein